jgi:hypothetical protein
LVYDACGGTQTSSVDETLPRHGHMLLLDTTLEFREARR